MANEEEKSPGFKVNDRRRFSAEGDLKPEFRGDDEAPAAAKPGDTVADANAPSDADAVDAALHSAAEHAGHADAGHAHHDAAHGHPHVHADHDDHADHAAHPHEPLGHAHHPGEPAAPELSFGTFLVGLSTQALVLLGDIVDPQTGEAMQDLRGAEQLIDIIGMLREKTRGNLDRDEAQLIEAVLYELRMKYVERARQAPR
ncbi:MAG: DUF1844 domain-containing protein [Candidatus Binataceae bacterium]|nr:DUF1844 domain-containing protein [Candidatus Binataceae bacterium]